MAELLLERPPQRRAPQPGPRRPAVVRRMPSFGGSAVAIALLCLSLTPSLLPRHWTLQGVVSGILMAVGYAVGVAGGALARRLRPRLAPVRTRAWLLLGGAGGVLATVFLQLGEAWQQEVRRLVGMPPPSWRPLLVLAVATVLTVVLVLLARAVRLAARTLALAFGRWLPRRAAAMAAAVAVTVAGCGLGYGAGYQGLLTLVEHRAATSNGAVELPSPGSPYLSGGPGSLVAWESLGAKGRAFVAGATPVSALAGFHRDGAVQSPIRVYVGHESAPDAPARARLAVQELERTGAFERQVVALVSTTGTGWVNPIVAESLEYLYGGDTALAAVQFSYLPSWVSFIAERPRAAESAAALVAAVRDRIDAMPPDDRPALVVYGESLGAYGVEAAFGDLSALAHAVDGALLAGPPHDSPIHRQLAASHAAAPDPSAVVYLRHATDPVVWWTPELLYREPEWLAGARSPDVSGQMRWLPVVTFWQVTVDLLTSTAVPDGHGHSYGREVAGAWVSLIAPPGWTDADTVRLHSALQRAGE